jgi:hypothetical protein
LRSIILKANSYIPIRANIGWRTLVPAREKAFGDVPRTNRISRPVVHIINHDMVEPYSSIGISIATIKILQTGLDTGNQTVGAMWCSIRCLKSVYIVLNGARIGFE